MAHAHSVDGVTYRFADLRTLLARASPQRSGDALAGVAATSAEERMAARMALADLPLSVFLTEALIKDIPFRAAERTQRPMTLVASKMLRTPRT